MTRKKSLVYVFLLSLLNNTKIECIRVNDVLYQYSSVLDVIISGTESDRTRLSLLRNLIGKVLKSNSASL